MASKKNKAKKHNMSGPATNASAYKGPGEVSNNNRDTVMYSVGDAYAVFITTDASGIGKFNTVVNSADVSAEASFTPMASLYEEYRVLSVKAEFMPKYLGQSDLLGTAGATSTAPDQVSPVFLCDWREDGTPLPTLNAAVNCASQKRGVINQKVTKTIRADELGEMSWTNTDSSIASGFQYGIKPYFEVNGLQASTTMYFGTMLLFWTVQFRIRSLPNAVEAKLAKRHAKLLGETKEAATDRDEHDFVAVPPPVNQQAQAVAAPMSRSPDANYVRSIVEAYTALQKGAQIGGK